MGVTDYGRGNKAITCRALGRRSRDSLFSWGAKEEYPACFWRKGDGSGEFYFDDLEEKLIINEMLKL